MFVIQSEKLTIISVSIEFACKIRENYSKELYMKIGQKTLTRRWLNKPNNLNNAACQILVFIIFFSKKTRLLST